MSRAYFEGVNVALSDQHDALVRDLVASGQYNNTSEVIHDALRRLETQGGVRPSTCATLADALEHADLSANERADFAADVNEYRQRSNERVSRVDA